MGEQRGIATEKLPPPPKKGGGLGAGFVTGLILVLLAAGAAFFFLEYKPMQTRLAELEGQLEAAQAGAGDAQALRDELAEARAELERVRSELERLQAERESLASESESASTRAAELEAETEALRSQLEDEIERGEILLRDDHGRLAVALADRVLFASGHADLNERGQRVLRRVAESLRTMEGKVIQVGGHTDNMAIAEDSDLPFRDNWELSSARATQVVRFLEEECGIEGNRLVAIGYNEHRPVAANTSPRSRRRNRRIDLILAPQPD